MKSLKQLGIVLAISMGVVLMVVGSMWLASLDPEMSLLKPTATSILPTVTLHPTSTPTPKAVTPTKESADATEHPSATPTDEPTPTPTEQIACKYPAGWIPHTLDNKNPGTLEKLAQLSIEEILEKNCLPTNTPLEVDMTLYLPDVLPTVTPTITPTYTVTSTPKAGITATPTPLPGCTITRTPYIYIVQLGDTLYSLSKYLGVTEYVLRQYNCLAGNLIVAGQRLYSPNPIPPTATPTPTVTPTDTPTPTATPTSMPTPAATDTPTPTPEMPTDTPTPTATNTPTPTATPDGGFIPTPVPTVDVDTPTPTPVPTNTPIPTATNTPVP